jgi:hypothetical protein
MKITALMTVINDEDYVWWALKSIYNAVDSIVIVEGTALDNWGDLRHFTEKGLSTDSTFDEIMRFMNEEDPLEKIIYQRLGFVDTKNALRQRTLELCPKDTEYCLVADADHLYDEFEIRSLRGLCERYPNIRVVHGTHLMFFCDMHHILWVRKLPEMERHLMRTVWSHVIRAKRLLKEDPSKLTVEDRRIWVPLIGKTEEEILDQYHWHHKIWTGIFDPSVGETLLPYLGPYPLSGLIEKHPFWKKDREWFGLDDFSKK